MEEKDNRSLIASIFHKATQKGAEKIEAKMTQSTRFGLRILQQEVEFSEEHLLSTDLSITLFRGKKHASFSTNHLGALDGLLDRSIATLDYTEEDTDFDLLDPSYHAKSWPELDLYHPCTIDKKTLSDRTKALEKMVMDQGFHQLSGTECSSEESSFYYANSDGFEGTSKSSYYSFSTSLIEKKGEQMQYGSDYTHHVDFDQLELLAQVADKAVIDARSLLGARKIPSCRCDVVFDPLVSSSLIGHMLSAISGSRLYKKDSFLVDSLGKTLLPSWVDVYEDPLVKQSLYAIPFDEEGGATTQKHLVQAGILKTYLLGRYSARRMGLTPTGHGSGTGDIYVNGKDDPSDILKSMKKGLWITRLMGQGVNYTNGDYSRGASGFWVENGEKVHPVHEITLAGNLGTMLQNLQAIGNDTDTRKKIKVGSILIPDMAISGS